MNTEDWHGDGRYSDDPWSRSPDISRFPAQQGPGQDVWSDWQSSPPPQERSRSDLGATGVAAITVAVGAVLALAGILTWLLLSPRHSDPTTTAVSSPASASTQVTTSRVIVTATALAPTQVLSSPSAPGGSASGGGFPAGADRSGWIGIPGARCNADDPASIIGRTSQASFSLCVNPDNGRHYYRGFSDGTGIEVDDPSVSGSTATVRNRDVTYSISSSGMSIHQGGELISQQPMVTYWVR